jgi:hypothetical protein
MSYPWDPAGITNDGPRFITIAGSTYWMVALVLWVVVAHVILLLELRAEDKINWDNAGGGLFAAAFISGLWGLIVVLAQFALPVVALGYASYFWVTRVVVPFLGPLVRRKALRE